MSLDPPLSHEQLLTLARKTEAAARDGDRDRLEAAAFRLFEALVDHVGTERVELLRLPPGEARLLLRGQQRVVDLLVDLAVSAASAVPAAGAGRCRCDDLAQHLVAQLSLQTDDERVSLVSGGVLS